MGFIDKHKISKEGCNEKVFGGDGNHVLIRARNTLKCVCGGPYSGHGHKGRKDAVEEINCMLLEIKQALEYSIDGCQCNGTEKCRYCSNTKDVLRKYFII